MGLGLASLIGQRTVAVILMIVLEIVLTPIFSRARIPHLLNLQRSVIGVAVAHLAPGAGPSGTRRRRRWASRRAGKPGIDTGVDQRRGVCHRCLARRVDGARRVEDDDPGRVTLWDIMSRWPSQTLSVIASEKVTTTTPPSSTERDRSAHRCSSTTSCASAT